MITKQQAFDKLNDAPTRLRASVDFYLNQYSGNPVRVVVNNFATDVIELIKNEYQNAGWNIRIKRKKSPDIMGQDLDVFLIFE